MSVRDSEPGDVFRDKHGRLWVVRSYCDQPSVYMERLIPASEEPRFGADYAQSGGVGGLMWEGFVKLTPAKPTGE